MIDVEFWVIYLALSSAIFCGFVAGEKNRSSGLWFMAGLAFSFVALIAVCGLPSVAAKTAEGIVSGEHRAPPKSWSEEFFKGVLNLVIVILCIAIFGFLVYMTRR